MAIDNFRGVYEFLSNFSRDPVEYQGWIYPTSEHAFQAAKARSMEGRVYVAEARTPGDAKRRGRAIDKRKDWDQVRNQVMLEILRDKFKPGSPLSEKLLATHPQELVEGNTWGDTYWGVCRGVGDNWLGFTLMKIRDELGGDL